MGWSPKEKWQNTKIFVEVFVSGGLLVCRGQFTLISPVGLVKSFPHTGIKDGSRARSGAGRNLFFTFFVSAASVVVEERRS